MTIDDENSIYVGGIRYDCTEDDLRRVFELYGAIIAVKVINDRGKGGKCYAFVTFTNPRAAVDAIRGMNGRTIGGRTVRVNEVTTRAAGVRPHAISEAFRSNQRGMIFDRDRGREHHHEEHDRGRYRDRSRQRDRGYELTQGENPRGQFFDKDHVTRGTEHSSRGNSRDHHYEREQEHDSEFDQERQGVRVDILDRRIEKEKQDSWIDIDSPGGGIRKDKDHYVKKRSRSSSYDRYSRELSTETSEHYQQEQLDSLSQTREELRKEKLEMEQKLGEKNQLIVDLSRRALKLEHALTSAKKVSSLRQTQLNKLYKCFLQVKDNDARLKSSEQELQALAESLMMDMDASGEGGV